MKLRKNQSKASNQQQNQAVNLPVEVRGFVDKDGRQGVKGIDLRNRNEVEVFLSDRGKAAENPNRPSIERLANGFKIGRDKYQLEEGGVVSFKGAFINDEKSYIALWPNVMAYNKQDAVNYVKHSETATLDLQKTESGKYYGALYCFENQPEKILSANIQDRETIYNAVGSAAQNYNAPAFVVRFVNSDNEVEACDFIRKKWDNENGKAFQPEDYASYVAKYVANMQEKLGNDYEVSIVPAERFTISPKGINSGEEDKAKTTLLTFQSAYKALTTELENGDIENVAKGVVFKTGGDNNEFVNAAFVNEPFDKGLDPVLIGGLKYSPNMVEENELERQGSQSNEDNAALQSRQDQDQTSQNPSADPYEDVDSVFEDLESDAFSDQAFAATPR